MDYYAPKYNLKQDVKRQLLQLVSEIGASDSQKIPSEHELADMFQISRATVRAVLAELEYDGVIFRRHGAGTFVNLYVLNQDIALTPGKQFREIILEQGYELQVVLESAVRTKAGAGIAKKLQIPFKSQLVVTKKHFLANQQAAVYCVNYIDGTQVRDSDYRILTSEDYSIYQILDLLAERRRSILYRDRTVLGAVCAADLSIPESYLPKDPGSAFLTMETTYYDREDRPLLHSKSYVNPSIIKYTLFCSQVRGAKHS